jgi:hypothetical protein
MVWCFFEVNYFVCGISSILKVEHGVLCDVGFELSYFILDKEALDFWVGVGESSVVQVNDDFVLVVARVIRESVVTLGKTRSFKVVPVKRLERRKIELRTSARTLAYVRWAAAFVFTGQDWSFTTWAHEHAWWTFLLWTIVHDVLGETLASSAAITFVVEFTVDWIHKSIIFTTAFNVLVSITAVVTVLAIDDKFSVVKTLSKVGWNIAFPPVTHASWRWAAVVSVVRSTVRVEVFNDVSRWADESNHWFAVFDLTFTRTASFRIEDFRVAALASTSIWLAFDGSDR